MERYAFARKECVKGKPFPLEKLARLVASHYEIASLESLLSRHLGLALNVAHGGITLDDNPENLQRDHIFPRSTLEKAGMPSEKTNHYASFHFLRGKDNLNKSDTAPHEWFEKPGEQPAYSDDDLKERLGAQTMNPAFVADEDGVRDSDDLLAVPPAIRTWVVMREDGGHPRCDRPTGMDSGHVELAAERPERVAARH